MKTDRAGRIGAVLLFLTGVGALVVGCATVSPLPEDARGSQQPAPPEPPLEVVGAPERTAPAGDIAHLPDTPHLDPQWRFPPSNVPVVTVVPEVLEVPAAPASAGGLSRFPVSGLTSLPLPSLPAAFHERPGLVLRPPPAPPLGAVAEVADRGEAADRTEAADQTETAETAQAADPADPADPEEMPARADGGNLVATVDDAALPEPRNRAAGEPLSPEDAAQPERRAPSDEERSPAGESTAGESSPPMAGEPSPSTAGESSPAAAASARSTQPSVPAVTASRAPRADTSGERRVEPGQAFEVALPGRGWIYLGGGDELQFLDRTTQEGDVVFSFRGLATDTGPTAPTTLEFESQDLATGRRTRHEERVLVTDEGDSNSTPEDRPADDNGVRQEAAAVDQESGETAGEGEGEGEVPADLAQADVAELLVQVDRLEAAGEHQDAVELLEAMRREGMGRDDEIIMRLAQLHESEWDGRDLPLARELYHTVVDNYPLSRWRRPARERIEYLNRHFFHIR